jgi:outer membrane receptor for ferrienterochelin and colicin
MAAQFATTGEIVGRITDDHGDPLAGAAVTLKPIDRVNAATTTTDRNGRYHIANITPGTYQLTVQHTGSATLGPIQVVVNNGSALKLDYRMPTVSAVAEELTVSAPAPQVETVKSEVDKYISDKAIQQLPLQNRTFLDVLTIVPGVDKGVPAGTLNSRGPRNSFNIHGGRSNENNFLIDGAPNNDKSDLNYEDVASVQVLGGPTSSSGAGAAGATFQVGTALQTFNIDAIKEVQVSTSLFTAEYGSGSGGVINVITRSGTDTFQGSTTLQHQSDNYVKNPPQKFKRDQGSLAIGGPIVKGQAHFFASFEHDNNRLGYDFNQSRFVVGRFLRPLNLTANQTKVDRGTLKVSQDFTQQNSFNFTMNYVSETADVKNSIFRASLENIVPEIHANRSLGFIARDVQNFGNGMLLESLANFSNVHRSFDSGIDTPRALRLRNDPVIGLIFDASGTNSPDSTNKLTDVAWSEKLNWFTGNRSWKVGGGIDRFKQDTRQVEYLALSYGFGTVPTSGLFIPATHLSPSVTDTYAFAQQDWFYNDRLTYNMGLRLGHDNLVGQTTIEPRFGVAYDLRGGGRSVLRAGIGIYHDRSNLIGATGADRPPVIIGNVDPVTLQVIPGTPPSQVQLDPNLKLPRIYKWVFGYEQQLPAQLVGGVHLFGSNSRDLFYTDQLNRPLNDPAGTRPNPTKGSIDFYTNSGKSDVYDLEFHVRRNFSPGSIVDASYTYEHTKGNSSFDFVSGNSPLNFTTFSDQAPQRFQVSGPLDFEVKHSFKLSGVAQLPRGFMTSGILRWRTGLPFSVTETFRNPQPGGVFPEGYNSRRLDTFFNLDARFAKTFSVRTKSLELFLDIFNVTNKQNVLERNGLKRFNNNGGLNDPGVQNNPSFLAIRTRGPARSGQIGARVAW